MSARDSRGFLSRLGDRVSNIAGGKNRTQTQSTKATLSADILRQEVGKPDQNTRPSLEALGVRAKATAQDRSHGTVKKAAARLSKLEKIGRLHEQRVKETDTYLAQPMNVARMGQVSTMVKASVLLGHLTAWITFIPVAILAVLMVLNDPLFVMLTVRNAFDVPTSVGFWDISNPGVLVAFAGAAIMTCALILSTVTGGKALAWIVFVNVRSKLDPAHTELVRSDSQLNYIRRVALFVAMGLITGGLMVLLHTFAAVRFTSSAFGNADATAEGVVWLITLLPLMILLFETVASAPAFVHARKVHSWYRGFRVREWWSLKREYRLLQIWDSRFTKTEGIIALLLDRLADTALRSDAQIIEAAISGGAEKLITPTDIRPESFETDVNTRKPPVNGSFQGRFLTSSGLVSHRVGTVLLRWNHLTEPAMPQLAVKWERFKSAEQLPMPTNMEAAHALETAGPHSIPQEDPADEDAA